MTEIRKLLVANRGEIAARVMRSARALDIATVAVYSDADTGAPFVADADEAVRLPGSSPADTYLRADLIIDAARRTGADAVHPGYGFLSENGGFARACAAAGLIFVGPPPEAIEAMGSKIAAKELMAAAGVPVLPGITIDADAEFDPAALGARTAEEIGYPVLVKAAFGGGGRGMRVVRGPDELLDAVEGARREAASAFGDGTVFLERFVDSPRHVEVQIFGDTHGTVVHLFERECSIQRRYQKIIEEAPSPVVDEALRRELGDAAVAAGKAIGYVGAGTVEFVLGADGRFHFLEVNTRLQVEHPVTELITGLDLVRLQLLVAEGNPLPDEVLAAAVHGHAVEVRLYAEDTAAGFLPASGTVHRFAVPPLDGVRVDAGVADGSVVGVHYDPMLAKVIAYGPNRDEACRLLAKALAGTRVHGLATNRELLAGILREPEFRAGLIDTGYLSRHDPVELATGSRDPRAVPVHALAAALAGQATRRAEAPVLRTLPSGWRNVANGPQQVVFAVDGAEVPVTYRVRESAVDATVGGVALPEVLVHHASADLVELDVDGIRRQVRVHPVGSTSYVDSALGSTELTELPRFPDPGARSAPGSLLAPMPGTVVRITVEAGAKVSAGTPVVVLEAMKMEHSVLAPHDGIVGDLGVSVGQAVDVGTVLAVVEEQEA
ncbi:ATP-grasp domain-containing protein [Amycolatopsis acidiphila]|uniref:Biotin-dependent 3-methylcrotonyl-coenzyme A carboxylase alpha1 subunit n=1 Tax=Amycolatopsis acidiphila TaxID=715473 RepID=A0A557ZXT6_9PSEU|nr:biotin carboxylase N-terminal domain-containing protein [Amycolatopsis acidiphila]TVT16810.1 ATP-grasp domain-containing protein [Amycolatopsis acidiphila]UIJ57068.1 ATP-grasp domain-containing protein [Amycolatopsis acidiphila]GHG53545.1 acetyl/propionyl-CoA carboxylase subuit alpha [Amycolatopsis acidiphila]